MFAVVEENYGVVYVTGPFETREHAEREVLRDLRSIVSDRGDDYYSTLNDDDLLMEWKNNPYDLFEDTDLNILVVKMEPPSK
jgi:hypothetical protein